MSKALPCDVTKKIKNSQIEKKNPVTYGFIFFRVQD
jgi:hypothetical protein